MLDGAGWSKLLDDGSSERLAVGRVKSVMTGRVPLADATCKGSFCNWKSSFLSTDVTESIVRMFASEVDKQAAEEVCGVFSLVSDRARTYRGKESFVETIELILPT